MADKIGIHVQTYRAWEEKPEKNQHSKSEEDCNSIRHQYKRYFFSN